MGNEVLIADRYRRVGLLGRGGMGAVYEAEDTKLGRRVAVKVLSAIGGLSRDETVLRRFVQEARALARIDHPGVVTLYDEGVHDGVPFLVMQLLDGVDLARLVRETGPLPPDVVCCVAAGMARALGAAHEAGVLHRDVKPTNVGITSGGRVVLARRRGRGPRGPGRRGRRLRPHRVTTRPGGARPDGERHTAFTGEMLTLLRDGIEDGPELIDLDTLHRVLEERLRAKNRPLPQRSQENGVGRLPLARNRARAARHVPAGPVLATDVRAAMAAGLGVARMLRAAGRSRDALPVLRPALQEQVPDGERNLLAVQLELSDMLAENGRTREAIEVLEQAFQQVHKIYGPDALLVCRRLADLLQESGSHIQACEVLKHALELAEDQLRVPD